MAKYRSALPQLGGDLFLTDGGIETTLIFLEGHELPYFAAFHFLKDPAGEAALRKYFGTYAALAQERAVGCVLESATWRANADWGRKLGYSAEALAAANRRAVAVLHEIRAQYETPGTPMVVSGCIGPRGDGYDPESFMSAPEAATTRRGRDVPRRRRRPRHRDHHDVSGGSDRRDARRRGRRRAGRDLLTVETDGRLPNGATLQDAIDEVDAATGNAPAYYMINCAHPTHFSSVLRADEPWVARIRGLRANASTKSHAALDQATALDVGNPSELASQYRSLRARLTNLNVVGGCCGTDQRHVDAICRALQES